MHRSEGWVDFDEIRRKVCLGKVLERYGVLEKLSGTGVRRLGHCPIHRGTNMGQFSVNLEKNVWNCFGDCGQGGGVIEFVAMKEFGDRDSENIRRAALLLKKWFMSSEGLNVPGSVTSPKTETKKYNGKENKEAKALSPLKFVLKDLDPNHDWFKERGFKRETTEYFGLGFCKKGIMAGRIAIPISNDKKQIVAYCGRAVTDEQIKQEGKYKQPPGFKKSEVVYNLDKVAEKIPELLVVESFLSVWWLHQLGIGPVVALMGGS